MIKVSVIMPSLNVVDYIDECMKSVVNQSLKDIEIICVDAGSTDGTYEKIKEYSNRDSRISLVLSEVKSYGVQVNIGIKLARGKYVAIVETDDFIDENMLGDLYDKAEQYELDFIKGDYESVVSGKDEKYEKRVTRMFPRSLEHLYNIVLKPRKIPLLHIMGLNIWRGIYNREFLINNEIYLNETKGAAFQDTAFYHQIVFKSERAMFVMKPYYKYRLDRAESSFRNSNTLIYTYNEYNYFIINKKLESLDISKKHLHFIYVKMFKEFLKHLKQYFRLNNYTNESFESINYIIEWFTVKLNKAVEDNLITNNDFLETEWNEVNYVNDSPSMFMDICRKMDSIKSDKKNKFWEGIFNKKVIIFGAGVYGRCAYKALNDRDINVVCLCDNNDNVTQFEDKKVIRPEYCVEKYPDVYYVIANKYYADDMVIQLEGLGIAPNMIIKYDIDFT